MKPLQDLNPDEPLTSVEYEKLTALLVDRMSRHMGISPDRLEHDVDIVGRSGPNQIDVVWEGVIQGSLQRLVFECRHYKSRLKRSALHAFRSVVDDIGDDIPTTGFVVTKTGYQSGAQEIADTYGIVIIELREPGEDDVNDRLLQIKFGGTVRFPSVEDVTYDFLPGDNLDDEYVPNELMEIRIDGHHVPLLAVLADGETNPIDESPREPHLVTKHFDPPAGLVIDGEVTARVSAIHARVGDAEATFGYSIGPGKSGLAWMAKNVLGGSRAWFTKDGKIWTSEA